MAEDYDIKEDPQFNPMHIEEFHNRKKCEEKGLLQLYELATSNFKQQSMPAWRPIPTLLYSISIFVAITILSLSLGIALLGISS